MQTHSPSAALLRTAPALFAALLAVLLAGCGSKPARHADNHDGAVATADAGSSAGARPGGGAYYKDDGPDAVPPTGLDAVPDAVPRIEPFHRPALRPYTVFGQRYVPMTRLVPYRKRGHASWYGRRFHGKPTSIGEPYDMYAMSAAHPTLPLPSYARVTNVANGRSVVVRVNDRGPFLRGRLIDLSYAAAHRLGYVNAGSALVEVEAITHEDIRVAMAGGRDAAPRAPAPAAAVGAAVATPGRGAYLQLGAFATPDNANDLFVRARQRLSTLADRLHLLDEGGRYRLQLGPFASADEARLEAGRIGALLDLQPFLVLR